jgi:signal transduction histidine kinase
MEGSLGRIEELRKVPIFAVLNDEQLARVAEEGYVARVARGAMYAREGEPIEHFYAVLEGELRISKRVDGREVTINTYAPGTFFGEVPLLAGTPFLASGRALSEARLFAVPEATFRRMLTESAPFGNAVLETMAERVQVLQSVAQQREKLDSLGTLAAGLAHEINNPAAASLRATDRLRENLAEGRARGLDLARSAASGEIGPADLDALEGILHAALDRAELREPLGSLEQSDREDELATWLEDRGVEEAWVLAPTFAASGLDAGWLEEATSDLPAGFLAYVLPYVGAVLDAEEALEEAAAGTGRVSALVGAVGSYSHMDEAPVQDVDVNKELEDTLKVLGYKLDGVEVSRDFDPGLPHIIAYGSELNQAWTQLIDNALDAAKGGGGHVRLRTACEADRVMVEVSDDGPGIPEGLQARVFEPFYTTKGVGAGVGLGLDISYRIIVGRHGGDIRVVSEPGDTRFQVRLPLAVDEGGDEEPRPAEELEGSRPEN